MKDFFDLIPKIGSGLTIINYIIIFFKWTLKNPLITIKYSNLTTFFLMIILSISFLILAPCTFFLKVAESGSLQNAFISFFCA